MRIQHNIAAMNSYRNYTNNVSAVNKNLEKLSSGYKINRAGDDAAGLAISEKMRAQIKGLEAAQKNVKDGVSLVKTAEGAMQEIQDMLDRMKYLATQSANGTYDNEVDRANLNKEVTALKDEINRIADSANFNGIKLLDGSLESPNGATMIKKDDGTVIAASAGAQFKQDLTITGTSNGEASEVGKKGSLQIAYLDKDGISRTNTITYTIAAGSADTATNMVSALKDMFGGDYNVTVAGNKITIQASSTGADQTEILDVKQFDSQGVELTSASQPTVGTVTSGQDQLFDITTNVAGAGVLKFEVDGTKFQVVTRGGTADAGYTALYVDEKITTTTTMGALTTASNKQIIDQLNANGVSATDGSAGVAANDSAKVQIVKNAGKGGGLQLQIGDTADSYNQMKVGVHDMHVSALGIAAVDISTQAGAAAAIDKIKDAINTVSSTRGDLGAIQNRLDHTLNNLSVMTENIQDAESTIRDTDIADEMMSYTKNNILIQSAQAMLAQANQIPQGVLQLLG